MSGSESGSVHDVDSGDVAVGPDLARAIAVESPLVTATDPSWVDEALCDVEALLVDHAHLEAKAAINALSLVGRRTTRRDGWVRRLTAIAREEVDHLAMVNRLLEERGFEMTVGHQSPYAAGLRKAIRTGQGENDTLDRLLVSSLIEARSAERFALLGGATHALAPMYADLVASERGHHRVFVSLAGHVADPDQVRARLDELVAVEAEVIAAQVTGPGLHTGARMWEADTVAKSAVEVQ